MSKISLIIKREYFTRVRNKTFIISTFLFPLVIVLFIAGSVLINLQGKDHHKVAVIDQNGFFKNTLKGDKEFEFDFSEGVDTTNYYNKGYSDVLFIPLLRDDGKTNYILKSPKTVGLAGKEKIEQLINTAIEDKLLQDQGISRTQLDSIRNNAHKGDIVSHIGTGKEGKTVSTELSYGIGFASGFLIYLLTFIYGASVMRGVMEEKTSRIAEVIISSVKPFQLMFGKIIGIGAVGITQFLMWFVLIVGLGALAQAFIPHNVWVEVQNLQHANSMGNANAVQASEAAQKIFSAKSTFATANWALILSCFLFYFLGGYMFYSALFASVGSVVNEDPQEAQSLMPITLPIVFSFIIMTTAVQKPDGPLAVWASIIPFSSPIVMMARIPFGVPWWQLALSMVTLIAGFLFTTWMAGKIYRTGILLYGKKATWREMWKWAFRRS